MRGMNLWDYTQQNRNMFDYSLFYGWHYNLDYPHVFQEPLSIFMSHYFDFNYSNIQHRYSAYIRYL